MSAVDLRLIDVIWNIKDNRRYPQPKDLRLDDKEEKS